MKRQVVILGLGQFGMAVARELSGRGVEIIAVDIREDRVNEAAAHATEALLLDASQEDALAQISPERRDACLVAIGEEAREASILCTALLRQMGAPRIISRAHSAVHTRILRLVGAHQVVNPEQDFGERFASQLLHPDIRGQMSLGEGVVISEALVPEDFVGQDLRELGLPGRFGVTVVAVRRKGGSIVMPKADTSVGEGDVLVVVARDDAVERMLDGS